MSPTYLPHDRDKAIEEQNGLMDSCRERAQDLIRLIQDADPVFAKSPEIIDIMSFIKRKTIEVSSIQPKINIQNLSNENKPSTLFSIDPSGDKLSYADIAAGRLSPCPFSDTVKEETTQLFNKEVKKTNPLEDEKPNKQSDLIETKECPPDTSIQKVVESVQQPRIVETLTVEQNHHRGRSPRRRHQNEKDQKSFVPKVHKEQPKGGRAKPDSDPTDNVPKLFEEISLTKQLVLPETKRGRSPSPMWVPGESISYAAILRGSSSRPESRSTTPDRLSKLQGHKSIKIKEPQEEVKLIAKDSWVPEHHQEAVSNSQFQDLPEQSTVQYTPGYEDVASNLTYPSGLFQSYLCPEGEVSSFIASGQQLISSGLGTYTTCQPYSGMPGTSQPLYMNESYITNNGSNRQQTDFKPSVFIDDKVTIDKSTPISSKQEINTVTVKFEDKSNSGYTHSENERPVNIPDNELNVSYARILAQGLTNKTVIPLSSESLAQCSHERSVSPSHDDKVMRKVETAVIKPHLVSDQVSDLKVEKKATDKKSIMNSNAIEKKKQTPKNKFDNKINESMCEKSVQEKELEKATLKKTTTKPTNVENIPIINTIKNKEGKKIRSNENNKQLKQKPILEHTQVVEKTEAPYSSELSKKKRHKHVKQEIDDKPEDTITNKLNDVIKNFEIHENKEVQEIIPELGKNSKKKRILGLKEKNEDKAIDLLNQYKAESVQSEITENVFQENKETKPKKKSKKGKLILLQSEKEPKLDDEKPLEKDNVLCKTAGEKSESESVSNEDVNKVTKNKKKKQVKKPEKDVQEISNRNIKNLDTRKKKRKTITDNVPGEIEGNIVVEGEVEGNVVVEDEGEGNVDNRSNTRSKRNKINKICHSCLSHSDSLKDSSGEVVLVSYPSKQTVEMLELVDDALVSDQVASRKKNKKIKATLETKENIEFIKNEIANVPEEKVSKKKQKRNKKLSENNMKDPQESDFLLLDAKNINSNQISDVNPNAIEVIPNIESVSMFEINNEEINGAHIAAPKRKVKQHKMAGRLNEEQNLKENGKTSKENKQYVSESKLDLNVDTVSSGKSNKKKNKNPRKESNDLVIESQPKQESVTKNKSGGKKKKGKSMVKEHMDDISSNEKETFKSEEGILKNIDSSKNCKEEINLLDIDVNVLKEINDPYDTSIKDGKKILTEKNLEEEISKDSELTVNLSKTHTKSKSKQRNKQAHKEFTPPAEKLSDIETVQITKVPLFVYKETSQHTFQTSNHESSNEALKCAENTSENLDKFNNKSRSEIKMLPNASELIKQTEPSDTLKVLSHNKTLDVGSGNLEDLKGSVVGLESKQEFLNLKAEEINTNQNFSDQIILKEENSFPSKVLENKFSQQANIKDVSLNSPDVIEIELNDNIEISTLTDQLKTHLGKPLFAFETDEHKMQSIDYEEEHVSNPVKKSDEVQRVCNTASEQDQKNNVFKDVGDNFDENKICTQPKVNKSKTELTKPQIENVVEISNNDVIELKNEEPKDRIEDKSSPIQKNDNNLEEHNKIKPYSIKDDDKVTFLNTEVIEENKVQIKPQSTKDTNVLLEMGNSLGDFVKSSTTIEDELPILEIIQSEIDGKNSCSQDVSVKSSYEVEDRASHHLLSGNEKSKITKADIIVNSFDSSNIIIPEVKHKSAQKIKIEETEIPECKKRKKTKVDVKVQSYDSSKIVVPENKHHSSQCIKVEELQIICEKSSAETDSKSYKGPINTSQEIDYTPKKSIEDKAEVKIHSFDSAKVVIPENKQKATQCIKVQQAEIKHESCSIESSNKDLYKRVNVFKGNEGNKNGKKSQLVDVKTQNFDVSKATIPENKQEFAQNIKVELTEMEKKNDSNTVETVSNTGGLESLKSTSEYISKKGNKKGKKATVDGKGQSFDSSKVVISEVKQNIKVDQTRTSEVKLQEDPTKSKLVDIDEETSKSGTVSKKNKKKGVKMAVDVKAQAYDNYSKVNIPEVVHKSAQIIKVELLETKSRDSQTENKCSNSTITLESKVESKEENKKADKKSSANIIKQPDVCYNVEPSEIESLQHITDSVPKLEIKSLGVHTGSEISGTDDASNLAPKSEKINKKGNKKNKKSPAPEGLQDSNEKTFSKMISNKKSNGNKSDTVIPQVGVSAEALCRARETSEEKQTIDSPMKSTALLSFTPPWMEKVMLTTSTPLFENKTEPILTTQAAEIGIFGSVKQRPKHEQDTPLGKKRK
uniref:Uncharacterized protein n=1 Tax=Clastoptera arizonana TaxID=38151 RepID=A0A1B6CWR6_9HEMI